VAPNLPAQEAAPSAAAGALALPRSLCMPMSTTVTAALPCGRLSSRLMLSEELPQHAQGRAAHAGSGWRVTAAAIGMPPGIGGTVMPQANP